MEDSMLTLDKIYHAAYVLKRVIRKTDIIPAPELNEFGNIYLKTENHLCPWTNNSFLNNPTISSFTSL